MPKPKVTKALVSRMVKHILGSRGRVWESPAGYVVGLELSPGREVVGRGKTLIEAFEAAFYNPTVTPEPPCADVPT